MVENGNGNGNGRLTPKQAAFVEEYLVDFNATRAAGRAGYRGDDNTLAATGSRLLRNDKVSERVTQRLQESAMSADEGLMRLAEIARGEWASYIKTDGTVDIEQIVDDGNAHLISEIRDTRDGRQYKFCDMQGAIVQILKAHGVFIDRQEITGADGGAIVLQYDGNVNPDDV